MEKNGRCGESEPLGSQRDGRVHGCPDGPQLWLLRAWDQLGSHVFHWEDWAVLEGPGSQSGLCPELTGCSSKARWLGRLPCVAGMIPIEPLVLTYLCVCLCVCVNVCVTIVHPCACDDGSVSFTALSAPKVAVLDLPWEATSWDGRKSWENTEGLARAWASRWRSRTGVSSWWLVAPLKAGLTWKGQSHVAFRCPLSIHAKIDDEDTVGFAKTLCPLSLGSFLKNCDKIHTHIIYHLNHFLPLTKVYWVLTVYWAVCWASKIQNNNYYVTDTFPRLIIECLPLKLVGKVQGLLAYSFSDLEGYLFQAQNVWNLK